MLDGAHEIATEKEVGTETVLATRTEEMRGYAKGGLVEESTYQKGNTKYDDTKGGNDDSPKALLSENFVHPPYSMENVAAQAV